MKDRYFLSHLEDLESEAIHVIREVSAQFENSAILFSGGKDSIVLVYLARLAFFPAPIPVPVIHIDTGHNFPETISFRDSFIQQMDLKLIVGSVQQSIDKGLVFEERGLNSSRNTLQTATLLEVIRRHNFDACMGGARRDEEKSRAKERFFSHRTEDGKWHPENQRAEVWHLFNGGKKPGENFRVFPISNWTELDIWQYVLQKGINLPSLYFAHVRKVINRKGTLLAKSPYIKLRKNELIEEKWVRYRTCGDMTITGAVESRAKNATEVINEISASVVTERGGRADDKRSETAMEDRKREGYF